MIVNSAKVECDYIRLKHKMGEYYPKSGFVGLDFDSDSEQNPSRAQIGTKK